MSLQRNEEKLVQDHLGLVISIAKKFKPHGNDIEDYIQIGCVGLLKAIRNFDYRLKTSLSTFAWVCITREILNYVKSGHDKLQELTVDPSYIVKSSIYEAIPDTLSTTEKTIINLRVMGYTFQEIGNKLGYSSAWSNKLYKSTLNKIIKANES